MTETTWLTQTQYDALSEELRQRTEEERPRIARLIDAARQEGDLSENGGYQAAREEQSLNETRILQLEDLLHDAVVGNVSDSGKVEPGTVVTAEIGRQKQEFLLGSRDAGEGLGIRVYSPSAPLGQAILGAKAGDKVEYEAPNGSTIAVKILEVKPYTG